VEKLFGNVRGINAAVSWIALRIRASQCRHAHPGGGARIWDNDKDVWTGIRVAPDKEDAARRRVSTPEGKPNLAQMMPSYEHEHLL
jgi:hypothetical protein